MTCGDLTSSNDSAVSNSVSFVSLAVLGSEDDRLSTLSLSLSFAESL